MPSDQRRGAGKAPVARPALDKAARSPSAAGQRGLRAVRLWVKDARLPGFREECRRQSLALAHDPQEARILQEIEAASDLSGWK